MTFGFATIVDAKSWAIVLLLSVKLIATIVLLGRPKDVWLRGRWNPLLWWSTKVTPVFAVPCMIAIALIQHRTSDAWIYGGLMLFVIIAVPIVVWRRFYCAS